MALFWVSVYWCVTLAFATTAFAAPTITISNPLTGSHLGSLDAFNGTASDPGGIQKVLVNIVGYANDSTAFVYWNGTTWQANDATYNATLSTPVNNQVNWSWPSNVPLPGTNFSPGRYLVRTTAYDNANVTTGLNYTVYSGTDSTAPTVTVSTPQDNDIQQSLSFPTGTATDAGGIRRVRFSLQRIGQSGNVTWTGSAWTTATTLFTGSVTPTDPNDADRTSITWTGANMSIPTGADVPPARYIWTFQIIDRAENVTTVTRTVYILPEDHVNPSATVTSPAPNSVQTGWTGGASGTAIDPEDSAGVPGSGVARVTVVLYRTTSGGTEYYSYSNNTATWGATQQLIYATLGDPDNNNQCTWSATIPGLSGGNLVPGKYFLRVQVYDRYNNGASTTPAFYIGPPDSMAPSASITTPASGANLSRLTSLAGTAADEAGGSGLARLQIQLSHLFPSGSSTVRKYWTGTAWSTTPTMMSTLTPGTSNWSITSNLPSGSTNLPSGTYTVKAYPYDRYENQGTTASLDFNVVSNTAPVASGQTLTTAYGTSLPVTLSATDAEGDVVTYAVATQPAHGTLSGTAPNLTYTPATGYSGPDSFTFTGADYALTGSTATVSITVQRFNSAPSAIGQDVSTAYNTAKTITLSAPDAEGDPVTFNILTQPAHGALSGTAPNMTYTPATNYSGPDSFTFNGQDYGLTGATATVSITVDPRFNSAPTAFDQNVSTGYITPKAITLAATDPQQDPLAYAYTNPTHGTLTGTAPNLIYTPSAGYHGPDGFTFTASDYALTSGIATVTIDVTPPPPPLDALIKVSSQENYTGDNIVNLDAANQTVQQTVFGGEAAVYNVAVQKQAVESMIRLKVTGVGAATGWVVKYYDADTDGQDITADVTSPTGWTPDVADEDLHFRLEVQPPANLAADGSLDVLITASTEDGTGGTDVVKASTSAKPSVQPDLAVMYSDDDDYIGLNVLDTNGTNQTRSITGPVETTHAFYLKVTNKGAYTSDVLLRSAPIPAGWVAKLFSSLDGSASDVTSDLTGIGYRVAALAPNGTRELRFELRAPYPATPEDHQFAIEAFGGPSKSDVVKTELLSQFVDSIRYCLNGDESTTFPLPANGVLTVRERVPFSLFAVAGKSRAWPSQSGIAKPVWTKIYDTNKKSFGSGISLLLNNVSPVTNGVPAYSEISVECGNTVTAKINVVKSDYLIVTVAQDNWMIPAIPGETRRRRLVTAIVTDPYGVPVQGQVVTFTSPDLTVGSGIPGENTVTTSAGGYATILFTSPAGTAGTAIASVPSPSGGITAKSIAVTFP